MDHLTQDWLSTLCNIARDCKKAIVFLHASENEAYTHLASWPEGDSNLQDLIDLGKIAVAKGMTMVQHNDRTTTASGEACDTIAHPLALGANKDGVIVLQVASRSQARQQNIVQQIQDAATWYTFFLSQNLSTGKNRLVTVVELLAASLEHNFFQEAATDVMTELANGFSCDRVCIGFLNGHSVAVSAVSHSASFEKRSGFITATGEAMYEAITQNCSILYPAPPEAVVVTRDHASLATEHGKATILTIPFVVGGTIAGAILAERSLAIPFSQQEKEEIELITSLVGPVLMVRHRDEQSLHRRIASSFRRQLEHLLGTGHLGLKVCAIALPIVLLLLFFCRGEYHITGAARLEALTQRVVVASQDGFIANANVRPGDMVHEGDVLGSLDDRDLKLMQQKGASQLDQLQTEYRESLAKHDRAKVGIIHAKIMQAEAQLDLVSEQLLRVLFTAPFDGQIVSGDLSQSLGSPVTRGQILFKVAPLSNYRIIIKVDEREIGDIQVGQQGNLVLSGMPEKLLPFKVETITPVSITEQGLNFFQIEAQLQQQSDLLRPGMEGIAKIDIGPRRLMWIWTHELVDWLRLKLWSWL